MKCAKVTVRGVIWVFPLPKNLPLRFWKDVVYLPFVLQRSQYLRQHTRKEIKKIVKTSGNTASRPYKYGGLTPEFIRHGTVVLCLLHKTLGALFVESESLILCFWQKFCFCPPIFMQSHSNCPYFLEYTAAQLESHCPISLTSFLRDVSCHARAPRQLTAAEL